MYGMTTYTGTSAIEYSRATGADLNKYADPTEGARSGLRAEEAERIAREDPGLIWVEVIEAYTARGRRR